MEETVVMVGFYVVMCCDVRIDAGTKCWSSGKGDYHVGHVTGVTTSHTLSGTRFDQIIGANRAGKCARTSTISP